MNEPNFLSHFINEDIYVVKSEKPAEINEVQESILKTPEAIFEKPDIITETPKIIVEIPDSIMADETTEVSAAEKIEIKLLVLRLKPDKNQESQESELLKNILVAIKIKEEDVATIDIDTQTDINSAIGHYNCKSAISFGVPFPKEMVVGPLKYYEPQTIGGSVYLLSHSLEELALDAARKDITRKKLLWKGLQSIFNL